MREALVGWNARHPEPEYLLVGETPFVGGRFVELARRLDDGAEPLLADPLCRFVIAVPSAEVRRFLEAERERRAVSPLHPREREDAPPRVLRDLWRELREVARELDAGAAGAEYDPAVYQRVYERILRHRNVEVVVLDVILPTGTLSVYDFAIAPPSLVPTEREVEKFLQQVERGYPDASVLDHEIASWWQT